MSLHPSQYRNAIRFISAPTKIVAGRLHCTEADLAFLKVDDRETFAFRSLTTTISKSSDAVKRNVEELLRSLSPEDGPDVTQDMFTPVFAAFIHQHIDSVVGEAWNEYVWNFSGFGDDDVACKQRTNFMLRKLYAACAVATEAK